jgi:hypothetical protein
MHYRTHTLGRDRRIIGPLDTFECDADEGSHKGGSTVGVELWEGSRLVTKLTPNEAPTFPS